MKNYKEYCKDCSYLIEKNKEWHCDMFNKPCKEIEEPNCFCEEEK